MAQIEKVYSRRTTVGNTSMWGTLHVNRSGGTVAGRVAHPYKPPKRTPLNSRVPHPFGF